MRSDAVEPGLVREQLAALIDSEHRTLADLERLLHQEHEQLVRNDSAEALEAACNARQTRMGELLRVQDERRELLRMLGQRPDHIGLDTVLRDCGGDNQLRVRWQSCGETAQRCRELNDRNSALVNARMKRVEGMLELLTGQQRPSPSVYGPQGQVASGSTSRFVAAEA